VPVIWVGLPAIRGTRSTSDMIYLNDLFRTRAERANIIYVDVWDGFVDESGRFTTSGPDVEGQVRRLRTSEGVFFTKAGARKLAHYVEREIKRVMGTQVQPVALPTDEKGQPAVQRPGQPAARPEAGPVVSLTKSPDANQLLGGSTRSGNADPLAVRVLVKGATVPSPTGRADNFFLTPEAAEAAKAAAAEAAAAAPPAAAVFPEPPEASAHVIAEEPKPDEQDAAKKPVASADPAPAAPPRRKSTKRPSESRLQQQDRPPGQIPRPTVRRDDRAVERRAQPPQFDPFGFFR
jgi:hypothetical protein